MPHDIEIELYKEDVLSLTPPDSDGDVHVFLYDEEQDVEAESYFNKESALQTIEALSEFFDIKPPFSLGVKASDISLNEALIRVAAAHETPVTFRYAKSDKSPVEVRTFVPRSVKNMDDHTTFVGDDGDRDGIRSFRSDRIKGTVRVAA